MNWKHVFRRAGGGVTIIQPPPPPPSLPQPTAAVGRPYFDYYVYKDGDQIVAEYRDGTKVATSADFAQVLAAVDRHATDVFGSAGYAEGRPTSISVMIDRGLYELQSNLDLPYSRFAYYIYGVSSVDAFALASLYWGGGGGERLYALLRHMEQTGQPTPLLSKIKLMSERARGETSGAQTADIGKYASVIRTNGHYIRLNYAVMYNIDIVIDGSYTSDTLAPGFYTYPYNRSALQSSYLYMYRTAIFAPFATDALDAKKVSVVDVNHIYAHYSSVFAMPTVPSDYNVYVFGNDQSVILMAGADVVASVDSGNLYVLAGSYIYLKDTGIGAYAPYTRLYSSCRGQVDIDGGYIFTGSYNEYLYVPVIEFTCHPDYNSLSVNIVRPMGNYGYYLMPIVRVLDQEVPVNNTPYRVYRVATITGDGSTTTFYLGRHNLDRIFSGLYVGAECPDSIRVTCSSTLPVRCYLSSDMQSVYAQFDTPPPAGQQVTVVWETAYVKYCRPRFG